MLETVTYMEQSNEEKNHSKPLKLPDCYVEELSCWLCEKSF